MLGMVLTYRLAAEVSKQDLDIYIIVRRTVSFAVPREASSGSSR